MQSAAQIPSSVSGGSDSLRHSSVFDWDIVGTGAKFLWQPCWPGGIVKQPFTKGCVPLHQLQHGNEYIRHECLRVCWEVLVPCLYLGMLAPSERSSWTEWFQKVFLVPALLPKWRVLNFQSPLSLKRNCKWEGACLFWCEGQYLQRTCSGVRCELPLRSKVLYFATRTGVHCT